MLALFILFLVQGVSAISSDIGGSYSPGETIIGKISGNILQHITKEQVKLKRGHVEVAFDYDFKKINNEYYVWLTSPSNQNNYTLIIEDIVTTVNGIVETLDYEKDFVVSGNWTDYGIKPGFIFADQDFEITATLYEDLSKTISTDFPETRDIVLNPGTNKIDFSIDGIEETQFLIISLGKYSVPAYIIGSGTDINQTTNQTGNNGTNNNLPPLPGEPHLRFNPGIIRSTVLLAGTPPVYPFEITNIGLKPINEIFFDYDTELFFISPSGNVLLEPNESASFSITLMNTTNREEIRTIVKAGYGNKTERLLLSINFTDNEENVETDYFNQDSDNVTPYYCQELGGKFCAGDETCSKQTVSSLDGTNCCTGDCEQESGGSSKAWIGYLIIAIVILVLLIVYVKYKKKKGGDGFEKKVSEAEKKLP